MGLRNLHGGMRMRRIALFMVVMFLVAGIAFAETIKKQKVGDMDVEVSLERKTPVVGKNMITVDVRDSAKAAVKDLKVDVEYTMPAMPGMPAMNYKTSAEPKGDKYVATMDLSMSGAWNVSVKITKAGKKLAPVKFNIDAQ